MVKERTKAKNPPASELVSRFRVLIDVGNYSSVRKLSKASLSESALPADDRAAIFQILRLLEPEPLVFWIGIGSVAVAAALAFWLVQ